MGDLSHNRLVSARTDIPRCTDIDVPVPYRENKHVLFGQQEGRCNGCRSEFPSASWRWTTSSPAAAEARTISRTCNCSAPTATA